MGMHLTFLYGYVTLLIGSLLGYFSIGPVFAVILLIAVLHALPLLVKERTSADVAAISALGVVHALFFSGLSYAVGRAIALTLSA